MSFDQPTIWIIILAVAIAAVVLDVVVVRLARRFWPRRGAEPAGEAAASTPAQPAAAERGEPRVYVLGAFSPVLTWLRYGRRPRPAPLAAETTAQPQPRVAPARPAPLAAETTAQPQPHVAPPRSLRPSEWPGQAQGWLRRVLQPANLRRAWSGVLLRPGESAPTIGAVVSGRSLLIEWSLLAVLVLVYCGGFLQFSPDRILTGNEAEVFQVNSWVLTRGLQTGTFPLWNPSIRSGIPYINDPMLHIFNPLTSLPVLVFGVLNGYKIALFLSFLAAAWGMWYLGRAAGLAAPARLWVALMYAFAGQPVAKFLQGHYLFVFGFAWIPWALAGLLLAIYTRRRRHVALAVVALSLVFLSGNAYYAFYMLLAGLVLAPVLVIVRRPRWHVDWRRAQVLAIVALLALGLIAIQLLPLAEFWPRLNKASNPNVTDSQTFEQVVLDLTSTDHNRPDARDVLGPEEYYAYSGWWPILALALLPLAVWKRKHRRTLVMGVVLLGLALIWIDLRDMPWRQLYVSVPFLVQFRYPTRMLIFAALALILLAGLALDTLWRYAWPPVRSLVRGLLNQPAPVAAAAGPAAPRRTPLGVRLLAGLAVVVLSAFLVWSAFDVFQVNRQLAILQDKSPVADQVASWLATHDQSAFYVSDFSNWHEAYLTHGLHYLNAWLYYDEIRSHDNQLNQRLVEARPNYWVLGPDRSPADTGGDLTLVQTFDEGYSLYQVAGSLPYAFTVAQAALMDENAGELTAADVTALTPYFPNDNQLEVIAQGQGDQKVVLLVTNFPGWHVTVDGRPADLLNVGGYLAVAALPGVHQYEFTYQPLSFVIGLVLSLLALAVLVFFLASDWPFRWAAVVGALRGVRVPVRLPTWRPNLGRWSTGAGWAFNVLGFKVQVSRASVRPRVLAPARALFALALLLYLATRLIGLERYPTFFFTDESVHTVLANDFVDRGLHNSDGELLPTYFPLGPSYNLNGVSVYLQVLPSLLFGNSVAVTRGTSALLSLVAALAVGLILRDIFRARYWWAATLLLSIAPTWFLHSRTAFEYAEVATYFAGYLYCYLRYRQDSPRYIYGAVLFGALAFYTHGLGVVLMGVTSVLFLLSDFRYHWQQRAVVARALLLTIVLAVPYVRYSIAHPSAFVAQLQQRGSMWTDPSLSLLGKLQRYLGEYAYGLSPAFWFLPDNGRDLARHVMDHYGNLWWYTLPLLVIGVLLTLWRVREARYRAVLLALLATPAGSALVAIGMPRMLWFVMPAVVLMALGLELCLTWVEARVARWRSAYLGLSLTVFALLAGVNIYMFSDALTNGGLWSQDYTLYGTQWGAQQLFGETIPALLAQDPAVQVYVSPSWANGADMFAQFFLSPTQQARVSFNGLDYYLAERRTLPADYDVVLTADEYARLIADPKIGSVKINQIIDYPNGSPGFYFVQYEYSASADALFASADEAWLIPVTEPFELDGDTVTVTHPHFGAGALPDLMDGNAFTLINAPRVNPLVLDFVFPRAWSLTGLRLSTGSMDEFTVLVELFSAGSDQPVSISNHYQGLPSDPTITLDFPDAPVSVDRVRISVTNNVPFQDQDVNIHLRDLVFNHAP